MAIKDLTDYLKPENDPTGTGDLNIDLDALHFEVDEAVIVAKQQGGGEAIVPTDDDNDCGSGACIL